MNLRQVRHRELIRGCEAGGLALTDTREFRDAQETKLFPRTLLSRVTSGDRAIHLFSFQGVT